MCVAPAAQISHAVGEGPDLWEFTDLAQITFPQSYGCAHSQELDIYTNSNYRISTKIAKIDSDDSDMAQKYKLSIII